MNKILCYLKNKWLKLTQCSLLLIVFLSSGTVFGVPVTAPVKIGKVADSIGDSVLSLGAIISDIALVAGIGFLLASFFKFDQHKKNPTQIPVSQPLTLLLIGASLCLFPTIMPLVQTAAFGSKAQRGAVGTSTVKGLIGTSS